MATILSVHLTCQHFRFYVKPEFQRPITRILIMVPIYSICSFATFYSFKSAVYINVIRDSCMLVLLQNAHNR